MRRMFLIAGLGLALVGGVTQAQAEDQPGCGTKWSVSADQAALASADLPSLTNGAALPALDKAAAVRLQPQDEVDYSVKPSHKPKASPAYGAELSLPTTEAGTIQVTLPAEAWVDVVQNGKVLHQSGYSGKSTCPGIHKSVRFSVASGPARLEISDSASPTLKVAVMAVH